MKKNKFMLELRRRMLVTMKRVDLHGLQAGFLGGLRSCSKNTMCGEKAGNAPLSLR